MSTVVQGVANDMVNISNSSMPEKNESLPGELHQLDTAYAVVEIICAVISVLGNCLVILVFIKYKALRTVTHYYVISLAIADLLVGLIGIPSALATSVGLPQNFQLCLLMNSLLLLLCTSSIFSLVAVTVDRFWCIMWPLTYPARMTRRNAIIIISGCWALAAFIGLLPSMGWNKRPHHSLCLFMEVIDFSYLAFLYFGTILAPSAFMGVVYAIIYKAVKRQVRRMSLQMLPKNGDQSRRRLSAESKAVQSIAVIVILFVISWMPLYTINTVYCFCPDCTVPPTYIKMAIVLSHFNSAWNPALYAWGIRDFRQASWRLLGIKKKQRAIAVVRFTSAG